MQHGSYKLALFNRVIVSQSFGSWNEYTSKDFFDEYIELATPLCDQPWGGLIDVREFQLTVPATEYLALKFEHWCDQNNRRYIAIVGSSSLINFQFERCGVASQASLVELKHFKQYDSAVAWFTELGLWQ